MNIENKQLLGEMVELMITENKMKNPREVMNFLNDRCKYHWERKADNININELNKNILNECYNYIRRSKENKVRRDVPENKMVPIYTGIKEKNTDFDSMLNAYKQDFERVRDGNRPKAIDFSATSTDFPDSKNVDVLVSQSLKDREKELENMQKHYNKEKAEEWLNNDKTTDIPTLTGPPKLVIHEKEDKKVRFAISPETTNQIMSPNIDSIIGRMKKREESEGMKEVINILKEILATQKEILLEFDKSKINYTCIGKVNKLDKKIRII